MNTAMQQGGGATTIPADVQAQVQQEIQEAISKMDAARVEAGAAQGGAVTVGPDGPMIIRGPDGQETVIIGRDAIPSWLQDGPPDGLFAIPIVLFISIAFVIVGLPIARAIARRMDRKHVAPASIAPSAELRQLQTSIDTMAVEIERMSEHQRFLTRVLSERTGESLAAPRDAARSAP